MSEQCPADFTLDEAATRLRDGRLTSVALVQAHLDRIAERDGAYHAFLHVDGPAALEAASAADQALQHRDNTGPLHGIPIGIKDIFDTVDAPTTYGSDLYRDHQPGNDAEIVRRIKAGGGIILGKLETYEFAMVGPVFDRRFPPAANPWDTSCFTGGSSSGSAAAVAGGLVRTSIGSDTGGSVRSPAAYCGVVGLKPTYGRISTRGGYPLSPSLDHVGVISASVREAAITFDAITDRPEHGASMGLAAASRLGQPLDGLKIGYARDWFCADPQLGPGIVSSLDDAASQLSLLGARIETVTLPDAALFEAVGAVIIHAEAFSLHKNQLAASGDRYSAKVFQNIVSGLCLTDDDLALGIRAAAMLRRQINSTVFSRVDALLTASTLTTAIPFADFSGPAARWTPMRTIAFNVTGHPALVLPCGYVSGLPVGLQLIGRVNDEATLCQIGNAFERSTDFSAIKPGRLA